MFKNGDKVLHLPTQKIGYIIGSEVFGRGEDNLIYKVVVSDNIYECRSYDLEEVCDVSDPFQRCEKGIYGDRTQYIKTNTIWKIRNSNNSSISSLKASSTLFKPHQFKPLLKFLESENRRILVADEVGLGKTIEAGHIMMEMKARGELKNVLIVCPKSLMTKWVNEMDQKFGLTFSPSEKMEDLINDLKVYNGFTRSVINYDKFNRYKDDENLEDNEEPREKKPDNNLFDYLEANSDRRFSLIICDEAHKVRTSTANTSAAVKKLLTYADAAVFLTATPLQTKYENLFNLLNLLDEDTYDNFQIFKNHINENKPFIKALEELGNHKKSLPDVASELGSSTIVTEFLDSKGNSIGFPSYSTVADTFSEYPLYKRAMGNMLYGNDTPDVRAAIRYDLSKMSMMNNIISRTRKREVTTDMSQAERNAIKVSAVLSDEEQKMYDSTIQDFIDENGYENWNGEITIEKGKTFAYVNLRQQLSSSVFGYLNDRNDLLHGIDRFAEYEDGKINELVKIIKQIWIEEKRKIIIFADYVKTLLYLSLRLEKLGFKSVLLYGEKKGEDGKPVDRTKEIERFQEDPDIPLLIANKVISEGLDLQFCDTMVNYDLPWNPMEIEQRIGRIDRMGQESQYVHIYNFIVAGSIQENIFLRLLDRIGLFRSSIGEIETILDAGLEKDGKNITLEELYKSFANDMYCLNWSKEVIEKKEQEIEQAWANERRNIEEYEEGFATALTNDAYFNQEINRILNNNSYVTEFELRNYIEMLIDDYLTQCTLDKKADGVYELVQPKSNTRLILSFLEEYKDTSKEAESQFSYFMKKRLANKQSLKITFNQELAFKDKSLEYINLYNPLILAATKYFASNLNKTETTFCYAVKADNFVHSDEIYFLAIYHIETTRNLFGAQKKSETMFPVLFNVQKEILENDDMAYHVWSSSQTETVLHAFCPQPHVDADTIKNMHKTVLDRIEQECSNQRTELNCQHENRRVIKTHDYEKWYESKRKKVEERISDAKYDLMMAGFLEDNKKVSQAKGRQTRAENDLKRLEESYAIRMKKLNEDPMISVVPSVLTISLISVIK